MRRLLRLAPLMLAALAAAAPRADAQFLTRPHLDWRTIETTHFRIHHPVAMAEWTRVFAARIESVHEQVTALVGSAPEAAIDVVIDDPYNVSNGMALGSISAPTLYLWPTPPEPGVGLGAHPGWSELLAVHEYAHLAHLTRPSRNPWQRLLWRLLPENIGPIARRSPRWVTEGYATYIEGLLAGGRPEGVYRPAVLRQLALEGRLPSYPEMSGSDAFLGGAMAYLAGSAYLEWLVQRSGEESLRHLWRRMTARSDRGFVEAFRGVYGDTPEDLYRRFTVEVTGDALRIEEQIRRAGLVQGRTVQRRSWSTGAPAVSPDGEHFAVALHSRDDAGRLVVLETDEPEVPERERRARERALERDPLDVPAIDTAPPSRRTVATLHPVGGRAHAGPRFFADGRRILVTRPEPRPDGSVRPDLFVWDWRSGDVRRVTHGAGIRAADPSPDGREAAGTRCAAGACDVVIIDLESGAVRTLVEGSPHRTWSGVRFAPDGRRIVAEVQERGPWRLAIIDRESGAVSMVPRRSDASRYQGAFLPGGDTLVAISEEGGIPNVVRIAIATGEEVPLTRVLGAAARPEPAADGRVYFLRMHGEGLDIARVHADSTTTTIALDPALAPVAPAPTLAAADTFTTASVPASRPYGLGPRHRRFLPAASGGGGWFNLGAMLVGTDPVGRLSWTLQGVYAGEGGWRGGSLSAEYRRWRPWISADAFHVRHDPSRHDDAPIATRALDVQYTGASAGVRLVRELGWRRETFRLGGSGGRLEPRDGSEPGSRTLAFAELDVAARAFAPVTAEGSIMVHGSTGRTLDGDWTRGIARVGLAVHRNGDGIALDAAGGRVERDAPAFEQFLLGGEPPPLTDAPLLSQRIAIPALPVGARGGDRFVTARATITGGGFEPYYLLANVGDLSGRWNRVIGIEQDVQVDAIPLARLPAFRALAGVGYSLDEPARREWRFYVTAIVRP